MENKPKVIILKESLLQSVIADILTFGGVFICMFFSFKMESSAWQLISIFIAIAWLICVISLKSESVQRFYSVRDAKEWIEYEDES